MQRLHAGHNAAFQRTQLCSQARLAASLQLHTQCLQLNSCAAVLLTEEVQLTLQPLLHILHPHECIHPLSQLFKTLLAAVAHALQVVAEASHRQQQLVALLAASKVAHTAAIGNALHSPVELLQRAAACVHSFFECGKARIDRAGAHTASVTQAGLQPSLQLAELLVRLARSCSHKLKGLLHPHLCTAGHTGDLLRKLGLQLLKCGLDSVFHPVL
mmetsp:Transcript_49641/g.115076  ORF Transcript_49641/g.115076 Transcript_49641/m.115076 type:complete len:215 (+) Transcript_49641:547-1191(+)